jgi:two-component system LytT family response regulator
MRRLRTLIAINEKQDVSALSALLATNPKLDLITACSYSDALDAIAECDVDIVVFDIDDAEGEAFDLASTLRCEIFSNPVTIFIASEAAHAARAFDMRVVDYILKPYDEPRLAKAIDYAVVEHVTRRKLVEEQVASTHDHLRLEGKHNRNESPHAPRIAVREAGRIQLLKVENIDRVEAEGRECVIHHNQTKHRIAGPFRRLAERLSVESFVQINRSILVNSNRIVELQEMCKGHLIAIMRNGDELPVSRRFRSRVLQQLDIS